MSEKLTTEALEALAKMEAAATPGPWITHVNGLEVIDPTEFRERFIASVDTTLGSERARADAELIATLRTHAAALIAAAREGVRLRQTQVRFRVSGDMSAEAKAALEGIMLDAALSMSDEEVTTTLRDAGMSEADVSDAYERLQRGVGTLDKVIQERDTARTKIAELESWSARAIALEEAVQYFIGRESEKHPIGCPCELCVVLLSKGAPLPPDSIAARMDFLESELASVEQERDRLAEALREARAYIEGVNAPFGSTTPHLSTGDVLDMIDAALTPPAAVPAPEPDCAAREIRSASGSDYGREHSCGSGKKGGE